MSVAQRCAAFEKILSGKQFPQEGSTATGSPSSVTDPRQHVQQTLNSQQHLQHASTDSRGGAPATHATPLKPHQTTHHLPAPNELPHRLLEQVARHLAICSTCERE